MTTDRYGEIQPDGSSSLGSAEQECMRANADGLSDAGEQSAPSSTRHTHARNALFHPHEPETSVKI